MHTFVSCLSYLYLVLVTLFSTVTGVFFYHVSPSVAMIIMKLLRVICSCLITVTVDLLSSLRSTWSAVESHRRQRREGMQLTDASGISQVGGVRKYRLSFTISPRAAVMEQLRLKSWLEKKACLSFILAKAPHYWLSQSRKEE